MIANLVFCLLAAGSLSLFICLAGAVPIYFLQGGEVASQFMRAWVVDFNGIVVGAFGYGLLWFVHKNGKPVLAQLQNIMSFSDEVAVDLMKLHCRATSWRHAMYIAAPLTALGGFVMWSCKFPLTGFAHYYLATCSISIYFVASSTLAFYLFTMHEFNYLERIIDGGDSAKVSFKSPSSQLDMDSINLFYVLSATTGVFAIYAGFRGTLTANFVDVFPPFKQLLVLPVLLFLPATLCYSFYPRYVIRKIENRDTLRKFQELETMTPEGSTVKERLELRKLILDIKEKTHKEIQSNLVIGSKDSPALVMSLVIAIQFVLQNDGMINRFFTDLFK